MCFYRALCPVSHTQYGIRSIPRRRYGLAGLTMPPADAVGFKFIRRDYPLRKDRGRPYGFGCRAGLGDSAGSRIRTCKGIASPTGFRPVASTSSAMPALIPLSLLLEPLQLPKASIAFAALLPFNALFCHDF